MSENQSFLADTLQRTADLMLADYERTRSFEHRPSKGSVRETAVLDQFLTPYMPQNVKPVKSSEVASLDDERSGQMDLLIVDSTAPFLLEADDYRVLAAETVFGVIEVKSYLSAAELRSAYGKIAKFKAMRRTAYHEPLRFTQTRTAYGQIWNTFPPVGIIFGYDGDGMISLGNAMAEVAEQYEDEPHLQVDSVWVLRKGSLTWTDPVTQKINVCPEPGNAFRALAANPGEVLLHLTAHLHEYFARAWTPGFRIRDYVGEAPFGRHLQAWGPSEHQS